MLKIILLQLVIDRIRTDELHAKNCKTIWILEAIIFLMESKMVEVSLTLNAPYLARV